MDYNKSFEYLKFKECEIISRIISKKNLNGLNAIEFGAGNCFLSNLIQNNFNNYLATDINEERLYSSKKINVRRKILDIENISDKELENIDIIISSNLLEHINEIDKTLELIHKNSKKELIQIHIMPNVFWRLVSLILFFPIKLNNLLFKNKSNLKQSWNNNQKSKKKNKSKFLPKPHGVSKYLITEFYCFSKYYWVNTFKKNNYKVIGIQKGPISSGYYIGLSNFKNLLFKIGFSTSNLYVIIKN